MSDREPWRDVADRFKAAHKSAESPAHEIARKFLAKQPAAAGPPGPQGPRGERGPSPDHEWDGTKLAFQHPDGEWGEPVDLRGPKGEGGDTRYVVTGGATGPQGPQGAAGGGVDPDPDVIVGVGFPMHIPAGKTWLIPKNTKVLATGLIRVDGIIDCEGILEFIRG